MAVGSRIYVVGGWNLQGANRAWHGDLLSLDLSAKQPSWEVVSKTPFKRRALAAAAYDGKLYVMGGITSDGELSLATDIYDLATGKWSSGPELPLGDHKGNGFGIAACGLDDGVYACGLDGAVYRHRTGGNEWDAVAKLQTPRFFHRLLPVGSRTLAALGGATWGRPDGHLDTVELVKLPPDSAE